MDTFLVHKSGNFVNFRFKKKKKKKLWVIRQF